MTRLFNLESYPELCAYAHLYNREVNDLIAQESNCLFQYKNFLDGYNKQGYLTDSNYLQELKLREGEISVTHLGVELPGENQRLYIVPDTIDLLTLERFFKLGERHLYKSVYHYWNNFNQISESVDLSNPVVFIDFNSVIEEQYTPLNFFRSPNSSYYIPILNNREVQQQLDLNLNFRDSYNKICLELSQSILLKNFTGLETDENVVQHLTSYLKKIKIFNLLHSSIGQNQVPIIVEILKQEKIYYKTINLNISLLENIVLNNIDFNLIKQLAIQFKEFSFIVISDYNIFPKFRESLKNDNIFITDLKNSQFYQIWQQKLQKSFPLFGQYLDQIEFQVGAGKESRWIKVLSSEESNNIYYEGETETKQFIGRIQETGQDYFILSSSSATLPIRINGKDYYVNGKAQDYLIKNPLEKSKVESEKLKVRIEFLMKPGAAPELRVRDVENKYKIETELCDRPQVAEVYNCIPIKTILEKRQTESSYVPSQEKCREIVEILSQFKQQRYYINERGNNLEQIKQIKKYIDCVYEKIHRSSNNSDLLLNVDPNHPSLKQLKALFESSTFEPLIQLIFIYIKNSSEREQRNYDLQNAIQRFVIFLGKTYKFSEALNLTNFFELNYLNLGVKKIGEKYGEYFKFLSRVAIKEEFQLTYFNCFFNAFKSNQFYFHLESYLWGYGRILAWYSTFQYAKNKLEYLEHFRAILYFINNIQLCHERYKEYRRNAFLALIYLLTFREIDKSFCSYDSIEFDLAKEVIELHKNNPVYLKRISTEKSLNKYFEELLLGESSMAALLNVLQVD